MARVYRTPGVYIEEKSAFPNSAVPVATAVPAFIGYTEKASRDNKDLTNVPTRINSFGEYLLFFGGPPVTKLGIGGGDPYQVEIKERYFTLHNHMQMFFSNGGSDCYIVSVGGYLDAKNPKKPGKVDLDKLKGGIAPLLEYPEPTMLVIPEAATADAPLNEINEVYVQMLKHCGEDMRSRFAIIDVVMNREKFANSIYKTSDDIDPFRNDIGTNNLQWGGAYFPYLHTIVVTPNEVTISNIHSESIGAVALIKDIGDELINGGALKDKAAFKTDFIDSIDTTTTSSLMALLEKTLNQDVYDGLIKVQKANDIKQKIFRGIPKALTKGASEINTLHQSLLAVSAIYKSLMADMCKTLNLLPPSAAMAGIYSMVDNTVGVFQSPANVSVGSVVKPAVNISSDEQAGMNVPLDGKAVNAIRSFPGKGTLVWGARTLDGNSLDWRYISVRRTVIFIEQSIKLAIEPYVFEPNTASTWSNIKAMLVNFLTNVWQSGALAGATAAESFSVDVGLGSTMTAVDILDGYLRISVQIAVTRPAEFIVITFEQKMQQS